MSATGLELGPDDWERLERLRAGFLGARESRGGALRSRWRDARDLELYDATFGRRIAWKWDAVLDELQTRGWRPPAGPVLDWGCGTGVAARALCTTFGIEGLDSVRLFDASAGARTFATERLREEHPELQAIEETAAPSTAPALLLVSHVLNELRAADLDALLDLARRSTAVLWVEPGEHEASRALSQVRERLRDDLRVLAPCTHQERCGALANETDWCHFFARPPAEVFQDRGWALFAKRLGIDLRSLPYAYLLLARREGAPRDDRAAGAPIARVIGRPRASKADVRFFACDRAGLKELTLRRRHNPMLYRVLCDERHSPTLVHLDQDRYGVSLTDPTGLQP